MLGTLSLVDSFSCKVLSSGKGSYSPMILDISINAGYLLAIQAQ
jgi:hypothetical protein